MRTAFLILCLIALPVFADPTRYGVDLDTKTYPQSTAKEALASALKAITAKNFRYLAAHLADPSFVDDRVKRVYGGKFEEQVSDMQSRLDALIVKQLARFNKDGKWDIGKTSATVKNEDVPDRCVRLVLKDGRWYLSHRFDLEK